MIKSGLDSRDKPLPSVSFFFKVYIRSFRQDPLVCLDLTVRVPSIAKIKFHRDICLCLSIAKTNFTKKIAGIHMKFRCYQNQ